MTIALRTAFPWFGGKSRAAHVVWRAFGNVPNYVEPFAGSLAVLLRRPHEPKIETVNDIDCYLSNYWRAVTAAPDEVAGWCDWPVNEADLHARHRWLVEQADFRARMRAEPEYFDAKIAGWWVWGLSMWIGSGWCQTRRDGASSRSARGEIWEKRPDVYARGTGKGVHRKALAEKRPNARNGGQGVHARLVHEQIQDLQGAGRGILAPSRLPNLGSERGLHGAEAPPCTDWFRALQARLRRVRVCCGDWTRVLTDSVIGTTKSRNSGMNPCGVFLDPPYPDDVRARDLYAEDDGEVWARVRDWAIAHGDDPDLRIALCGYEGEHEMPASWTCHAWKGLRGYGAEDNDNRHRERIWFSPHCLPLEDVQPQLFAEGARG